MTYSVLKVPLNPNQPTFPHLYTTFVWHLIFVYLISHCLIVLSLMFFVIDVSISHCIQTFRHLWKSLPFNDLSLLIGQHEWYLACKISVAFNPQRYPLPSNRHHRSNDDWRVRGIIIRSVLCSIVCNDCAQCNPHIYEQTCQSFGG